MTLDETYARILTNLPREHGHHTRRLLQFLAFSERPLTIEEAVDALAVDLANIPRFDPKNRMPVPKEIVSYCSSLVVLTINQWRVEELQLAHLSVKDYLLSNRVPESFAIDFNEVTARASIAQVCLAYLIELDKFFPVGKLRESYRLAQYSARYWMDHAVVVESGSKQVCTLIAEFLSCEAARSNCYRLYNPDQPLKKNSGRMRCDISLALYYASLGGSCFSVRLLLDKNANVNRNDEFSQYGTALNAAVYNGHDKIVQMLLEKNASMNIPSGNYFDALQAASGSGYDKIVRILLDNGADADAQGGKYFNTALVAASYHGHDKVVQILLDYNADVNAEGGYHDNALYSASINGHDKVVQILLDNNANINAQRGYYDTALYAAIREGHDKVVQKLLDKGAKVRSDDLEAALYGGHHNIAQMIRDRMSSTKSERNRQRF